MASRKLPKGTPEFEMFGEFYQLVQKYYEVEETMEYWDALIEEANNFAKAHKDDLGKYLALAFCNYQEAVLKKRKENKR